MNRKQFMTVALASLAAPVLADDTAAVKKAIQGQYDAESAALAKKDAAATLAVNTTDFTSVTTKGETKTRAVYGNELKQVLATAKSVTVKTTVVKVVVKGDTALVTVSDTSKLVLPNPQTKKMTVIEGTTTNEDTWVKQGGKWLRKANKALSEKVLIDGKPASGG